MPDIRHRIGVAAPPRRVYEAVATKAGVEGWWTHDVRGESREGGELAFYFGRPEPALVARVLEAVPEQRVVWHVEQGPEEWVGTDVSFEISTDGEETALLFTHANWREPVAFMHHCSTKWAYFLLGLKAGMEGGSATPYPNDAKISSWG